MKTPAPLATIIATPQLRYFGPEGDGGGGGDPGGGDPGAGGGGDPNADIMSFAAPDMDRVTDILTGKVEGDLSNVSPKPPEKKETEVEPKPGEPDPKLQGEPPAKQLRVELEAVKKERDELKKRFETGDPRLTEAENRVKAKETEIAEAKQRISDYERQLALADPAVTAKLRDLDAGYDKDAGRFYQAVPELDTATVKALVSELHGLPVNTPEYKEARLAFEKKVNEALGGSEDNDHRKLGKALDFIERTYEFALERPKVQKEINESSMKLRHESQTKDYSARSESVRAAIERAKKIPEGAEKTDPYHPKIMLDVIQKVLPPEQVEAFNKGIPEFIELVMAGVRPRAETDYAGMTPEQVKESQAAEQAAYDQAREQAPDVIFNGLRALRMLPYLAKEVQRLRGKVKEDGAANPPDPTAGGGGGGKPRAGGDEIKDFAAPDLATLNFS